MTNESYLQDLQYQGKSLEQWVKAFNNEFTPDALLNMIRAGADLNKMLLMGLDEAEKLTPYEGLPDEQKTVFEAESCDEACIDEISHEDEMAAFGESTSDVYVTVGDFKKALARNLAKDSDKIMFRVNKKAHEVFQMSGKGGTFVIDLVPELIDESIRPKWMVKAKVLGMTVGFTQPEETKEEAEKAVRD